MKTTIVTDSTADVPDSIAGRLNIHVIPAVIMFGDQSFEDGKGLTRQDFYNRLPEMDPLPTTGTPSVGSFESAYQKIFDLGSQNIISIHVASLLSGIHSTAKIAAQKFGNRVQVIDSESLSMGIGFQTIVAAEKAAENLPIEKIIQEIELTRQKTRLFAMLDTLEYIRRSGRVGWARARIGSLLRIKPFLEVKNGRVFNMGQARTRKRGIIYLKNLLNELGPLERLAILHTNAETDAHSFLNQLDKEIPSNPLILNVTTVIGTHVGPNGLGFAAVLK